MNLKSVVIELRVQMIREVPADWNSDIVEFKYNESSHCLGTEIEELYESDNAEEGYCDTCHRTAVVYLRDATEADIENLKLREKAQI